eukprot:maker-scaffold191_size271209-snap-gene-0.11 protein:Tk06177 transcript:maker-scaffold191_size271209-snap-gene-0.11-mRNA-1 annotation:"protein d2 isoform x2"
MWQVIISLVLCLPWATQAQDWDNLDQDLGLSLANVTELQVTFENEVRVSLGQEMVLDQVKNLPRIQYQAQAGDLFTLMMIDPDAPNRKKPVAKEWLHWLVVNIPGDNLANGQTVTAFRPSGPPAGSGFHRYVFLLFKQSQSLGKISSLNRRSGFNALKFAKKNGFPESPEAANYYKTQRN